MAQLQQPDVVGNFLSNYYTAQQKQQADQDRTRTMQRQDVQDQRAESQFNQQMDLGQIAKAKQIAELQAELLGGVREGDAQGFSNALQQFSQATGTPIEKLSHLTVADIPRLKVQSGRALQELELQAKRASISASNAQAEAARALAGQRANATGFGGGGRPLPTRLQSAEDEDIGAIQTTQSINAQLDGITSQIDSGELDIGPINNIISRGQNYVGASNEGSTNFATMMSTLEKMRNDSLILNKGVQTEGDAVRAWNALIANVNDPKVVKAQIARIKTLNDRAASQKVQLINIRRARNGAEPFDPSQIAMPGQAASPQAAPAPQPQGGAVTWQFDANGNLVPGK